MRRALILQQKGNFLASPKTQHNTTQHNKKLLMNSLLSIARKYVNISRGPCLFVCGVISAAMGDFHHPIQALVARALDKPQVKPHTLLSEGEKKTPSQAKRPCPVGALHRRGISTVGTGRPRRLRRRGSMTGKSRSRQRESRGGWGGRKIGGWERGRG